MVDRGHDDKVEAYGSATFHSFLTNATYTMTICHIHLAIPCPVSLSTQLVNLRQHLSHMGYPLQYNPLYSNYNEIKLWLRNWKLLFNCYCLQYFHMFMNNHMITTYSIFPTMSIESSYLIKMVCNLSFLGGQPIGHWQLELFLLL